MVGGIERWASFYLLLSSAFAVLMKASPRLAELNWAETILAALLLAAIISGIGAATLAAFRYFRPLPPRQLEGVLPEQRIELRRSLIGGNRHLAYTYVENMGPFRTYVERQAIFVGIRRHLPRSFLDELQTRGNEPGVRGELHPMAKQLLDELDALEAKWDLV